MTIDFSDWVRAVDAYGPYNPLTYPPVSLMLLVVGGGFLLSLGVFCRAMASERGERAMRPVVVMASGTVVVFAALVAFGLLGGKVPAMRGVARPDPFTVVAEQRFGITGLKCAAEPGGEWRECSFDELAAPRYAQWIRDGETYRARIVAHGTRVTLAPDATGGGR